MIQFCFAPLISWALVVSDKAEEHAENAIGYAGPLTFYIVQAMRGCTRGIR